MSHHGSKVNWCSWLGDHSGIKLIASLLFLFLFFFFFFFFFFCFLLRIYIPFEKGLIYQRINFFCTGVFSLWKGRQKLSSFILECSLSLKCIYSLKGAWILLVHFPTFLQGRQLLWLLSCTSSPFWQGVYSKRKEFAPKEQILSF